MFIHLQNILIICIIFNTHHTYSANPSKTILPPLPSKSSTPPSPKSPRPSPLQILSPNSNSNEQSDYLTTPTSSNRTGDFQTQLQPLSRPLSRPSSRPSSRSSAFSNAHIEQNPFISTNNP